MRADPIAGLFAKRVRVVPPGTWIRAPDPRATWQRPLAGAGKAIFGVGGGIVDRRRAGRLDLGVRALHPAGNASPPVAARPVEADGRTVPVPWGGGSSVRHPEHQYLDLLAQVLDRGDERVDRTGVGTRSLFGAMIRFDLADGSAPILTTKRVYWKTAVKEMLWFLTGQTNIQPLLRENVRIWSDWPLATYRRETGEAVSQEAFERRIVEDDAFAARWGELGPVYGKQWRRWLGSDGREYDQIGDLVRTLREDPASRRMLFHGWNVAELGAMALPPCHMVYQYHVTSDGRLNCLLFQRSVDLLLGAAFNFVGATALQLMLAQQADLRPGELVWVGGDVHLYLNHLEQAREQAGRSPRPFPKMRLIRRPDDIDGYRIEDFEVEGYAPHKAIRADVAV